MTGLLGSLVSKVSQLGPSPSGWTSLGSPPHRFPREFPALQVLVLGA